MIIEKKLNNGITVIIEHIEYVQSVATGIFFKAGAVDETAEKSGISHFIEHMMFKGTEKRNAKEIAEDVDMIGGSVNAFTGKENTCYHIKTISENFEAGIEILSDMLNNSLFDEEEISKERNVIIEEMKMIEDTPDELAIDMLGESVLRSVSTGRSIIGTRESVNSIRRNDILAYIKDHYTAGNMVISIAGNVDSDKVITILEKYFGGIKTGATERSFMEFDYKQEYIYKYRDIEQTHIALGNEGVSYEDEDRFALTLYSSILGGSMSSRLFQKVREEKGLAYTVQAFTTAFVDNGYFAIYAAVGDDKASQAMEAIGYELDDLRENGITDHELDLTKEQIKGNYIFGQESTYKRMFANGRNKLLLGRFIPDVEVLEKVNKVKKNDIMKIAENFGYLENYTPVILSRKEYDPEKLVKRNR